ncbi:hypothetical protein HH310_25005 [Actinoplanes sp. TBRC 11911]|uniref:hypothetical protein n=1 Tax=Actinoplanes sp. TBRC 11911 TaxID=2729386 RepID=UPI00145E8A92|nr:hypothetical protein [Actinoplanes sp. TBRC 11911]NMO54430.1 hypothetical protein [Actinoplanes sp. TBRC 11911]
MTREHFDYTQVLRSAEDDHAGNVIASIEAVDRPLQAVLWSVRHDAWIYAPSVAARILYNDEQFDRLRDIDRQTAERVARDDLHTDLPAEDVLVQIIEDGERSGMTYGPPVG